jgi:hypothetical protein
MGWSDTSSRNNRATPGTTTSSPATAMRVSVARACFRRNRRIWDSAAVGAAPGHWAMLAATSSTSSSRRGGPDTRISPEPATSTTG